MNEKRLRLMLENAGKIQHVKNLFKNNEMLFLGKNGKALLFNTYEIYEDGESSCISSLFAIDEWVIHFLMKNRELKGGLKTPMQRYYAWKALNRKEFMDIENKKLNNQIVIEILTDNMDDVMSKYKLSDIEYDEIEDKCIQWLVDNAEEWNDYNPKYPNNLYHSGYKLSDGTVLITDYSGVAGKYWITEGHYSFAVIN